MKSPALPFVSLLLPVLLVLLLQLGATPVGAECCGCGGGLCADNTGCSAFSCCAHGPCEGCRTPSTSFHHDLGRHDSSTTQQQDTLGIVTEADLAVCMAHFVAADINGDGNISFVEWAHSKEAFGGVPWETLVGRWSLYDWEGKGYLTREEAMERKF